MGSSIAWFSTKVRRAARSARVSRLSVSYDYGWMDIQLSDREVGCYVRQGLIYKIWAASNIDQNGHFFFY